MSRGSKVREKLGWLAEVGAIRSWEWHDAEVEVVTGDGKVHDWSYRDVERFWAGAIAAMSAASRKRARSGDPLDDQGRDLTMILIEHDIALQARRAERTGLSWPDESDIFDSTRQKLRDALECTKDHDYSREVQFET